MRVWVVSALVMAIAVAGVLYWTGDPTPDKPSITGVGPRFAPLTEKDVRRYLDVMPKLNGLLSGVALEFEKQRMTGQLKKEEFGAYSQQRVATFLRQFNLTPATFDDLRTRVEHVVDVLRAEKDLEKRLAWLDEQLAEKKRHRELMKEDKDRALIDADVADLEKQRVAKLAPLRAEDRALVKLFWQDLDRAAPRTR